MVRRAVERPVSDMDSTDESSESEGSREASELRRHGR